MTTTTLLLRTYFLEICLYIDDEEERGETEMALNIYPQKYTVNN